MTQNPMDQNLPGEGAQTDLAASRALFWALFYQNQVPAAISRWDDHRLEYVNLAWERLTGWERETVRGRPSEELGLFPELEKVQRIHQELSVRRRVGNELLTLQSRDGARHSLLMSAQVIDVGGVEHLISSCVDVTDRVKAEAALQASRDQLAHILERINRGIEEQKRLGEERRELELQVFHAQKMECLGTLAGGVAHDMNNVLGAILGIASTCRQGQDETSNLAKAMDTIVKACDRGRMLVGGLLDFSRKDLPEGRPLDLNTLLREAVQLLERTTLQKIRLVQDLDPGIRPILGDPAALRQVIMNICINSVDAMPEGGTLALRSRNAEPDLAIITIEDTGCGIPKDIQEKVLDPFFTTKPQGKGTGLGLSIAYSAVKAHHGQMEIQSQPGEGTNVVLSFPTCQPEPEEEAVPPDVHPDFLILVVDDDELVRCSMEILIGELAMQFAIASSGEEALGLMEDGLQPDLVILDVNMPGMGGAGFLPRFRAMHPDVPVLLTTGRVDQAALDLAKAHPGVEIFPKPFSFEELGARLKAISPKRPRAD